MKQSDIQEVKKSQTIKISWAVSGLAGLAVIGQILGVLVSNARPEKEQILENESYVECWREDPEGNESDPGAVMCDKPVIYIYPTEEMGDTEVNVKLDLNGSLTTTYPKYSEQTGWNVVASPDGTLKIKGNDREYYSLYWEGKLNDKIDFTEGNLIAGEDTREFLEKSLKIMGLTDKEAEEFIIYWLPKMECNPYNFIQFHTQDYTDKAKLTVSPAPDTLIRIYMTFRAYDKPMSYKMQDINSLAATRQGYTVVEWGGSMR